VTARTVAQFDATEPDVFLDFERHQSSVW
jgi:hypothetical protein